MHPAPPRQAAPDGFRKKPRCFGPPPARPPCPTLSRPSRTLPRAGASPGVKDRPTGIVGRRRTFHRTGNPTANLCALMQQLATRTPSLRFARRSGSDGKEQPVIVAYCVTSTGSAGFRIISCGVRFAPLARIFGQFASANPIVSECRFRNALNCVRNATKPVRRWRHRRATMAPKGWRKTNQSITTLSRLFPKSASPPEGSKPPRPGTRPD